MIEISVIVPTVGRPARLERLLTALSRQTLARERFEVFVALDGADAASVSLLRAAAPRFSRLGWSEQERRAGPAAARNRAWRSTSAPVVAMTDDDCEPSPGWLAALAAAFADDRELGVALGRTYTDRDRITPFSHYVENAAGEGHQTCNAAYRRELLERLGGFDERFPGAYLEDTDLYCRAARVARVRFVPDAAVYHPPREATVVDLARSARKYEGDFIFFRKDPELYRRRHEGRGPLAAVLYGVGVRHAARQAIDHLPWLRSRPGTYFRYLAALALFEVVLWTHAPIYWRRHRAPAMPAAAGAGNVEPAG